MVSNTPLSRHRANQQKPCSWAAGRWVRDATRSTPENVEDGVHDLPGPQLWSSVAKRLRQERLDQSPLSIGQIRFVARPSRLCCRRVAGVHMRVPEKASTPSQITPPPPTQPFRDGLLDWTLVLQPNARRILESGGTWPHGGASHDRHAPLAPCGRPLTCPHAEAKRTLWPQLHSPPPRVGPLMPVLAALSVAHLLNDLIQSMIPAIYPVIKDTYQLDFAQIGLITLAFQVTSSILQPLLGYLTDRRPWPYAMVAGMGATLLGLLGLSFATQLRAWSWSPRPSSGSARPSSIRKRRGWRAMRRRVGRGSPRACSRSAAMPATPSARCWPPPSWSRADRRACPGSPASRFSRWC